MCDGIRKRDIVLPEFQREYVWSREQAKQLMVSLVKAYPVGSLLFWKTDEPPELKNIDVLPEKLGTMSVMLDGQQRLTTLYMFTSGGIPPYYKEQDIQTDPRDLYYNIDNGDFQYYRSMIMKDNPVWVRVVDCFGSNSIKIFEIARKLANGDHEVGDLAERYNNHLTRMKNIVNMDLPVLTVPSEAKLNEAIDIFDRVNSQGTKLTDADLALTHVTGRWAQARREVKQKIDELSEVQFHFDLTFMTRALTGVVTKRALYEVIHDQPREKLIDGWKRLSKILDYMVKILPGKAYIHSSYDLNTNNVYIPIIVYLSQSGGKFPTEKIMKHAIHWLYCANTWARYSGQTDQRLEYDVSMVVRENDPWDRLVDAIIDQRGRIEFKPSDFEGRGASHPLFLMTYILTKAQGGVDWFNGLPLTPGGGKYYRMHNHHIFPTSLLYSNGYETENHLHRKIVNEIANRVYLTAESNLALSDTPPEEYLPTIEENYPGALCKQFIPMDPALWKVEHYPDFLEARRNIIAMKINEYFNSLISEPVAVKKRPITELITLGESGALEFKSTLQWDVIQNKQNKDLRKSSLKTLAAFLNSEGGTLVIGVEDNGNIFGLDNDLSIVGNSIDRFENLLVSLIRDCIGAEFGSYVKIRFEDTNGKKVCVVDVDKSASPVYLTMDKGAEFYIRMGNTSRLLDIEEAVNYISMHWD